MTELFVFQKAPFLPTLLPNLQLWLDASDTSATNIVESGGLVSQWSDKSGQGNNVTGSGAARPTTNATTKNGKNVLDFNGNDSLVMPSALHSISNSDNTIFLVSKRNTEDGSGDRVIECATAGTIDIIHSYSSVAGQYLYKNRNTPGGDVVISGLTNTDFQLFTSIHSGTTSQSLSVNSGTADTNSNGEDVATTDECAIGSNAQSDGSFLIGSIAEIIIYNRALTATEVASVNNYLSNKWGI